MKKGVAHLSVQMNLFASATTRGLALFAVHWLEESATTTRDQDEKEEEEEEDSARERSNSSGGSSRLSKLHSCTVDQGGQQPASN